MSLHPYSRLFHFNVAPTFNDDETLGYEVGDEWIFGTDVYKCTDATEAAASWVALTGGGAFDGVWDYDTSTTMADPGEGAIRSNHATGSSVTQLAIHVRNINGFDNTNFLVQLSEGDVILIQEVEDAAKWARFSVNGTPTNNTTWFLIPVDYTSSSGTGAPDKNIDLYVQFSMGAGAGTGGGVTDHGALTGLADDDHTQYHTDARGDVRYAPIAKGVTNGDTHDHSGGDGGAIAYSSLTGTPAIPTQEEVEDIIGAMFSGNTESGITITYDDTTAKINADAQTAGDARYHQRVSAAIAVAPTTTNLSASLTGGVLNLIEADLSGLTADRTLSISVTGSIVGTVWVIVVVAGHATNRLQIAPGAGFTLHGSASAWEHRLQNDKQAIVMMMSSATDMEVVSNHAVFGPSDARYSLQSHNHYWQASSAYGDPIPFEAHLWSETNITGTSTLLIDTMHFCTGTTSDYTVTLPTAVGYEGRFVGIRVDPSMTKLLTVEGNGSELIDGALNRVMWKHEVAILMSDGAGWIKIYGKTIPMQCEMRRSSNQTGVVNNTVTKVTLNQTDVDNTSSMGDTTNARINIKRSGMYSVMGVVIWSALTANSARTITEVRASGTGIEQTEGYGPSGGYPGFPITKGVALTAGNYLELYGFHQCGSNQSIYGTGSGGGTILSCTEIPSW